MGVPVVASALPGNSELLGADYPGLVEPRESVDLYVEALSRLAMDPQAGVAEGAALRKRAREQFTLRQMAAGHEELYDEILATRDARAGAEPPLRDGLRFRDRPLLSQPLVSVIVPHYNQPQALGECIDSVWTQTYPNVELIVVDDCSTADGTAEMLEELDGHEDVTVIQLDRNGGPSRARNVAIERCSGRYVLPVDADNVLLPDAIERLVEQLSTAGEEVGFIYPNLQFFGNREDYFEPPSYNAYTLLHGNFCDTCSLIDRTVFDAGLRYRAEIELGHEDWEFVLQLAAHGVRGERAHGRTLLYRKSGFNRSDMVDHAADPFDRTLRRFSPFAGREEWLKAREAPSLSLVSLAPIAADPAARRRIAERLAEQSSIDVELIAPYEGDWPELPGVPQVRRLPVHADADQLEILRCARAVMRGTCLVVSEDPELNLLTDRGFAEKVLRRFGWGEARVDAIAFVDVGAAARHAFRSLAADEADPAAVHTAAWRVAAEHPMPSGLLADPAAIVRSAVQMLSGSGASVEWRHAEGRSGTGREPRSWHGAGPTGEAAKANALVQPLLPGAGAYEIPRWERTPSWVPPLATVLIRYRDHLSERRLVSTDPPPFGYLPEYHLGALRTTSLQGTERLLRIGEEFVEVPTGRWEPPPKEGEELGYFEQAPLPQFKCLAVGVYRPTGQQVLVTLPDDPLLPQVDVVEALGFIEPFPIQPPYEPPAAPGLGLVGLVKSLDERSRRHRYALGSVPEGDLLGELGALAESERQGDVPAWIVDGRLITGGHTPIARRARPLSTARWVAEPASWHGIADRKAKARATVRRSATAAVKLIAKPSAAPHPEAEPAGWLFEDYRPGLTPLYASYHPTTGDQLIGRSPATAAEMGYADTTLLGFARLLAPVTGNLEQRVVPVRWARRIGIVPRSE
jgi:GT2 family glycosyltransferase